MARQRARARTRTSAKRLRLLLAAALVLGLAPAVVAKAPRAGAVGPDGLISLAVYPSYDQYNAAPYSGNIDRSQRITTYKWLINADVSGDTARDDANCLPLIANDRLKPDGSVNPNPLHPLAGTGNFPDACQNPGIHSVAGSVPIVTSGDQNDLGDKTLRLPNGKYLISVTAPGFKIDGVHFTVNGETDAQRLVVTMSPLPVKTLTVRVNVFNDNASTNGAWDGALESYTAAGSPDSEGNPVPHDINNMSGFVVHLSDVLGEVTTDVYGNALCTEYEKDSAGRTVLDGDGMPVPKPASDGGATGGHLSGSESRCVTGPDGQLAIPNLGPNRYAVNVVPPDPQTVPGAKLWMQTTTLEGGKDWDSWNQEGGTGFDTERMVGGEATPMVDFGFVQIDPNQPDSADKIDGYPTSGGGSVRGTIAKGLTYTPTIGAPNYGFELGAAGTKIAGPMEDGLVSLNCLGECPFAGLDQAVWVGRTRADGSFAIPNVPQGTYMLTAWNEALDWRLYTTQVNVKDGVLTDVGTLPLLGWFTRITGHVFLDTNGNGRQDPGERGVPEFTVTIRGRSNYGYDQGQTSSVTKPDGSYSLDQVYPLTQWVVEEAYDQRYKTTGITWQADNQPAETTIVTSQVDIDVHPVIGLGGRIDWGVQPYARGENGGIVGTVSYDSTRNETNGRKNGAEDYQPSIPGLPVQLWAPRRLRDGSVELTSTGAAKQYGIGGCARPLGDYGTDRIGGCKPLNTYTTETWTRPKGCTTRDGDGNPIQMLSMPPNGDPRYDCLEAPLSSVQVGGDGTVDGNYGFGTVFDSAGNEVPIPSGDYLVEVVTPLDTSIANLNGRAPRPIYKFSDETSINVFSGDTYVPQDGYVGNGAAPSPPVPHVAVNPAGDPLDDPADAAPARDAKCAGAKQVVDDSTNPDFVNAVGGSIFNGLERHRCDVKLVRVVPGRSIAPTFFMYTEVPTATHFLGLVTNDLGVSTDKRSMQYGEVQEISNMPIGVYDEAGRLKWSVNSDYNGRYEMILPSTDTYNCPLPAGPCPNVYRLVANDPGQPGRPNATYNPAYRTIATEFQGWPGVVHPVDQAPTPIAATIESPASQQQRLPECAVSAARPQLYRVDDPIITRTDQPLVITGTGFGATRREGEVTLDGIEVSIDSWSDTQIKVSGFDDVPKGPHNLQIRNANGATTVSGLTIHVTGTSEHGSYTPHVFTVRSDVPEGGTNFNPANDFFVNGVPAGGQRAIQRAIEAAHAYPGDAVVVVYPNEDPRWAPFNPDRAYFENIVVHSPLKLQGVGPGGPNVAGSTINGSSFFTSPAGLVGPNGSFTQADGAYATDWAAFVRSLPRAGNPDSPNAEVVFVVAESQLQYAGTRAAVDGFTITGGEQLGFPNNINDIGGAKNGSPAEPQLTQGGGIFVNAYVPDFRVTNNVVKSNGGTYGGGIRVGTPELGPEDIVPGVPPTPVAVTNANPRIRILNNRVIANGGSNLAGGIALFNGSDGYEIANNDICGNFSTEYGGGISHYGFSPGGSIHDNRIVLNSAYDEGGGILVAGELPFTPMQLSNGAGPVDISNNLIQANLSNDDGGGIRFLMAAGGPKSPTDLGNYAFNVENNFIISNVATHEGGGVALDDTPNVRFVNNTVARNLTTATAVTSNGLPAAAGLATGANSALLQRSLNARYGTDAPRFSNPVLLNDIFVDNRAGTWTSAGVKGLGIGGPGDVNVWDIGSIDGSGPITPVNSVISSVQGYVASATNRIVSSIDQVGFKSLWDVTVDVSPLRTNPQFRQAVIVSVDAPVGDMGDYHLAGTRPLLDQVLDLGAASVATALYGTVTAPTRDFDGDPRPGGPGYDAGADELPGPSADLSITKTDARSTVMPGDAVQYTIEVHNDGPSSVRGAPIVDVAPPGLENATWSCSASTGSSCAAGSGTGNITTTVDLAADGIATFKMGGVVSSSAGDRLVNTAEVSVPAGIGDPDLTNNTATDSDTIVPRAPTPRLLDGFGRPNGGTLGSEQPPSSVLGSDSARAFTWSQSRNANGVSPIRIEGRRAVAIAPASAYWNGPESIFGANQVAGFTFAGRLVGGTCLVLKATLGTADTPGSFLRVCYESAGGGRLVVSTTTDGGASFVVRGTVASAFESGDSLSAIAASDGTVYLYKNAGCMKSFIGLVSIPTSGPGSWSAGSGGGRVGVHLPEGAKIDDFKGGTLP